MIPAIDLADFRVFGVTFHTFGLLVAFGVLLGHQVVVRRARALGLAPIALVDRFVLVVFTVGHAANREILRHATRVVAEGMPGR